MENSRDIKSLNKIALSKFIFFIHKSKLFFIIISLTSILVKKFGNNTEIRFKCPFRDCIKTYSLKNKFLAHLRTHIGIKPYQCETCLKSFNDKGNLKTHLRIHTGERPYKCIFCEKSFKAEGQMKEHLGSHYKDKPFQCPYCLKYYKRKGVVKNHILIHFQDPSFLEKKEFYLKEVDNLNTRSFQYLYESSNKNNSSVFSTKEESQNNSPKFPIIKSTENSIKEFELNLDKNNTNSDSYENKIKNCENIDEDNDFEENENNKLKDKTFFNSEELFQNIFNVFNNSIKENNLIYNEIIFPENGKYNMKNEDLEEKTINLKEVIIENKHNIIALEDIL